MSTVEKKITLIEWLLHLEDKTILKKIERLLEFGVDKWDELSKAQQREINESIAELDKGKGVGHHTAMTKLRKR